MAKKFNYDEYVHLVDVLSSFMKEGGKAKKPVNFDEVLQQIIDPVGAIANEYMKASGVDAIELNYLVDTKIMSVKFQLIEKEEAARRAANADSIRGGGPIGVKMH